MIKRYWLLGLGVTVDLVALALFLSHIGQILGVLAMLLGLIGALITRQGAARAKALAP